MSAAIKNTLLINADDYAILVSAQNKHYIKNMT